MHELVDVAGGVVREGGGPHPRHDRQDDGGDDDRTGTAEHELVAQAAADGPREEWHVGLRF
ncbi:hypothetical protein GCM10022273_04830 [Cellulomonas soli]